MPMIPDDLLSEIINAHNLVELVSSYIRLQRRGNEFVGLCPFHNEKTPSFSVNDRKQLYHCFGCGAGGNVVNFIMQMEGLDFIDAIQYLADAKGIVINQETGQETELASQKRLVYKVNKQAALFYHHQLLQNPQALKYLSDRRISLSTIKKYGIGYALDAYDNLIRNVNADQNALFLAGLLSQGRNGYYDRFRGRIMFPIINTSRNVVGFGGRSIDDQMPKYLNSPKTIVFDKGSCLFSLNFAKHSEGRQLILTEGYMDVCTLYQNGFKNVVATLGTALTTAQARIIAKYADILYICYDSDQAGRKAVLKAIDIFLAQKSRRQAPYNSNSETLDSPPVRILVPDLRDAKDPDEFISKYGQREFSLALEQAVSAVGFKLELLNPNKNKQKNDNIDPNHNKDYNNIHNNNSNHPTGNAKSNSKKNTTTEDMIEFLNASAKILAAMDNEIEMAAHVKQLASETGIPERAIFTEINKLRTVSAANDSMPNAPHPRARHNRKLSAEAGLISILAADYSVFSEVAARITDDFFENPCYNHVVKILRSGPVSAANLIGMLNEECRGQMAGLLSQDVVHFDKLKAAEDAMARIEKKKNMLHNVQTENIDTLNAYLLKKRKEDRI